VPQRAITRTLPGFNRSDKTSVPNPRRLGKKTEPRFRTVAVALYCLPLRSLTVAAVCADVTRRALHVSGGVTRHSLLDSRHSTLDTRSSTLDSRLSTLDTRSSTLDSRHSTLAPRLSTLDTRHSTLAPRHSIACQFVQVLSVECRESRRGFPRRALHVSAGVPPASPARQCGGSPGEPCTSVRGFPRRALHVSAGVPSVNMSTCPATPLIDVSPDGSGSSHRGRSSPALHHGAMAV
jgi:hypothetical protein